MFKGSSENRVRLEVVIGFIAVAVALRLLPHFPNFAPLTAIALFGGARLGSRSTAAMIVLSAMAISDTIIGFDVTSPVVYLTLAAIVILGGGLQANTQPMKIFGYSLSGSLLFFLTTNFAVWLLQDLYPKTAAGLAMCYTAALPFLTTSAVGDLFYCALLFGAFSLFQTVSSKLQVAR